MSLNKFLKRSFLCWVRRKGVSYKEVSTLLDLFTKDRYHSIPFSGLCFWKCFHRISIYSFFFIFTLHSLSCFLYFVHCIYEHVVHCDIYSDLLLRVMLLIKNSGSSYHLVQCKLLFLDKFQTITESLRLFFNDFCYVSRHFRS